MGYDISNLHIDESSPAGQAIQKIVARENVTPEEVVRRGLDRIAKEELSPADQMWGVFSSPEDVAILDDAMGYVHEMRRQWVPREIDL